MKIDNLRVHWRYEKVLILNKRDKIEYETEKTTCVISSCVPGNKELTEIASGSTICSLFQVSNRDIARKESLKRALANLPSNKVKEAQTFEFRVEQKKFRTRFWEAYRVLTQVPRWNLKKVKQAQKA